MLKPSLQIEIVSPFHRDGKPTRYPIEKVTRAFLHRETGGGPTSFGLYLSTPLGTDGLGTLHAGRGGALAGLTLSTVAEPVSALVRLCGGSATLPGNPLNGAES